MGKVVSEDLKQSLRLDLGSEGVEGDISRRGFFKWAFLGATTVASLLGLAGFFEFFLPHKTSPFGGKITAGKVADFPVAVQANGVFTTTLGPTSRNRDGHFFLVHLPEGLIALHWKCVHLGCTVPFNPNEEFPSYFDPEYKQQVKYVGMFHCPCHGSTYVPTGQIVAGPAPRPLDLMEITLQGDTVIVDSGKITSRPKWDKSQAVKIGLA
jgi:cytochrome b6-f complex iron-sulfur subunit